jgi:uncharacterized protein YndB with AHSA1/START domain
MNRMNEPPRATIRIARHFSASAERVFDAWFDAQRMRHWLFATPRGEMVRAEVDARVGGAFIFTDRRDGIDVDHIGEYRSIDRPRRLVFTFTVPLYSAEPSTVSVDITPSGARCELVLTHQGVLAEYRARTEGGWTAILAGLTTALGE